MAANDILTEDEFCKELINRFFNENSYFLHCFKHALEKEAEENQDNDEDYVLIGSMLDKLVNSENKVDVIDELAEVNEFAPFREKLYVRVRQLRESDSDPERMKIEIETLAQNLLTITSKAVQNEDTARELNRFLGLASDFEEEEDMKEPSLDESDASKSDFTLEEKPEDLSAHPEETDSSEDNFDMEVEKVDGFDSSDSEEGGSFDFDLSSLMPPEEKAPVEDAPVEDVPVEAAVHGQSQKAELTGEPTDLVDAFRAEVEKGLSDLGESLNRLESDSGNMASWKECYAIFEKISSSGMIYGFDGFEQIATKARNLVSKNIDDDGDIDRALSIRVLRDTETVLRDLSKNNIESVDSDIVEDVSKKLTLSDHDFEHHNGSNGHTETVSTQPDEIKLPGEDDEEILSLVQEIRTEDKSTQGTGKNGLTNGGSSDSGFKRFKQKCHLYFRVLHDALQNLGENPAKDSQLVDDIKLACRSITELSAKYQVTEVDRFPKLLLAIADNFENSSFLLSEGDQQLIIETFEQFRSLRNEADAQAQEYQAKMKMLTDLHGRVKDDSDNGDAGASSPSKKNEMKRSAEIFRK